MRLATSLVRGGALAPLLVTAACSLLMDTTSLTKGGGEAGRGIAGDQSTAGASADAGSPDMGGGSPGAGAGALGGSMTGGGGSLETGGALETGGTLETGGNSVTAGTSGSVSADAGVAGGAGCIPALKEYCDGLDNDCNAGTPDVCPSGCTGHVYAGKGYMVCNASSTYTQGETACKAQAMDLVKIDDTAENAFVLSLLKPITLYGYIGGTDAEKARTFKWPDGTIVWANGAAVSGVYQNFSSSEPANMPGPNCLQMTRGNSPAAGTWSDTLCTEKQPFVCERY